MFLNIAVKDLGHSAMNRKIRALPPEKDGSPNKAIVKQKEYFNRVILKGKPLTEVNPANRAEIGWKAESVFGVERKKSDDAEPREYSTLRGEHRRDWLQGNVDTLTALAAKAEGSEKTRLQALADAWNAFEVPCEVVSFTNDAKGDEERAFYIAKGNEDAEDKDARIEQSYESRFDATYEKAPIPKYLYQIDPNRKDPKDATRPYVYPTDKTLEGWSGAKYPDETGIRGNVTTVYAALTRLGRHFGLPKSFFQEGNRLKVTNRAKALVLKETKIGDGKESPDLGFGIEKEYCIARAEAALKKDAKTALDECKEVFKARFLALMDEEGHGVNALDHSEPLTPEEKEAKKKEDAEKEAEANENGKRLIAASATYAFERDAIARGLQVKNAPSIEPEKGNAFDLLLFVSMADAAKEIGEWANDRGNTDKQNNALAAIVAACAKVLPAAPTAAPITLQETVKAAKDASAKAFEKEAAHAHGNTPKKGKK